MSESYSIECGVCGKVLGTTTRDDFDGSALCAEHAPPVEQPPLDPQAERADRTRRRLLSALDDLRPARWDVLTTAQRWALVRVVLASVVRQAINQHDADAE
jgi:hypothetical protein